MALVNKGASTSVCKFLCGHVSLLCINIKSLTAGLCGKSIFEFYKKPSNVFQSGRTIASHQQWMKVPVDWCFIFIMSVYLLPILESSISCSCCKKVKQTVTLLVVGSSSTSDSSIWAPVDRVGKRAVPALETSGSVVLRRSQEGFWLQTGNTKQHQFRSHGFFAASAGLAGQSIW